MPPESELRDAAAILNQGEKVAILVGHGAAKAGEVAAVAEKLGARAAKTSLGREVLPDDEPYVTGPIGLLGSTASHPLMMSADTLFMIGTSFPVHRMATGGGAVQGRGERTRRPCA